MRVAAGFFSTGGAGRITCVTNRGRRASEERWKGASNETGACRLTITRAMFFVSSAAEEMLWYGDESLCSIRDDRRPDGGHETTDVVRCVTVEALQLTV